MLTTTINAIAQNDWQAPDEPQWVYLIHEDTIVFYVGRTNAPASCIMEMIGEGERPWQETAIDLLVRENLPHSRSWSVTLLTLDDCTPYIAEHDSGVLDWYERQPATEDKARSAAAATIAHHRPCLNQIGNRAEPRTPLPARYVRARITNAGVRLPESS